MKNIKFYKYRGCDDLDRDLKIITDNKIWYSNPSQFNDPFDCAPTKIAFTFEEKKAFARQLQESDNPEIPDAWRDTLTEALKDERLLNQMVDRVLTPKYVSKRMSQYGVLALSKTYDNILLWSHYSTSHRGFVIEFDITKKTLEHKSNMDQYSLDYFESKLMAKPVEYSSNRPPSISVEHHLAAPYFHKSCEWAYEEEYRVLSNGSAGLKCFDSDLISGIYLGCNVSKEHKQKILGVIQKFIKKSNIPVRKYQARTDSKKYKLHFDEF